MSYDTKDSDVTLYVKWFNPMRGYGFAISEQYDEDVFLHFSSIQKAGHVSVTIGNVIVADVERIDGKLQITTIKSICESSTQQSEVFKLMNAKKCNAVIKWFNKVKGYGFATDEKGKDIFIHINTLLSSSKSGQITNFLPGDKVTIDIVLTPKGLEAVQITEPEETYRKDDSTGMQLNI